MRKVLCAIAFITFPLLSGAQSFMAIDGQLTLVYNILSQQNKTVEVGMKAPTKQTKRGVEQPCELILNVPTYTLPPTVTYEGITYQVKRIADKGFEFLRVRNLILPDGLEEIGQNAFEGHVFYSVLIPSSVIEIGACAFVPSAKNVRTFSIVSIPRNIQRIGASAFSSQNGAKYKESEYEVLSLPTWISSEIAASRIGIDEKSYKTYQKRYESGALSYAIKQMQDMGLTTFETEADIKSAMEVLEKAEKTVKSKKWQGGGAAFTELRRNIPKTTTPVAQTMPSQDSNRQSKETPIIETPKPQRAEVVPSARNQQRSKKYEDAYNNALNAGKVSNEDSSPTMPDNTSTEPGILVPLRCTQYITSKEAQPGQRIDFVTTQNIVTDNGITILAGTPAYGQVISVRKASAAGVSGHLSFKFVAISLPNGELVQLEPDKIDLDGKNKIVSAIMTGVFTAGLGTLKKGKQAELSPEFEAMAKLTPLNDIAKKSAIASADAEQPHVPVVAEQAVQPVSQALDPNLLSVPPQIPVDESPMARTDVELISDVDIDIPQAFIKNENAFAIIIANEKYDRESEVQFATNDGKVFKQYCQMALGIPEENIHYKENATLNNIIAEVDWLKKVCDVFGGEAKIIFYYAGHGIPDESSKDAYLLPVDGIGSNVATGYKLSKLYETLGKMKTENVTVFLDACFSGMQRDDKFLVSARGVAIKTKPSTPKGAMVVMSAAQGDETAYPYKEKGHGLFTYFLLKKLQESRGECTMEELGDYIKSQVSRRSIIVNGKPQTPSVNYAVEISDKWKDLKLK